MLSIHTSTDQIPEFQYVAHVLFKELLGIDFVIHLNAEHANHRIKLPNGNTLEIENHAWKAANKYELPTSAQMLPHPFQPGKDLVNFYGSGRFGMDQQLGYCGIDLFASTFFMLSRWEESGVPGSLDQHGRFPAQNAFAFRQGFLHRPVVNEWADLLWCFLERLGWSQTRPQRKLRLAFSCDVDHPRLWWHSSDKLKTLVGAILKRNDWREATYFAKNYLFNSQDPYDVFDEWFQLFKQYHVQAQFNFLGERAAQSDCYYPINHVFIKKLIQEMVQNEHSIGFHPSYESLENPALFNRELQSLQAISPGKIISGRQHYLRFIVSDTWRQWHEAGLESDSSMGYPEAEGFRCGICHDFPVFDLKSRTQLPLRELPLIAMDVTLAMYRGYTPAQAASKLQALYNEVKVHNGVFTLLWHNSSWNTAFWEPYKSVLLDFIQGFE